MLYVLLSLVANVTHQSARSISICVYVYMLD